MNWQNDEDWGHHKCHLFWKQANPEVVEKSQRDDNRPRNIDVSKTKIIVRYFIMKLLIETVQTSLFDDDDGDDDDNDSDQ